MCNTLHALMYACWLVFGITVAIDTLLAWHFVRTLKRMKSVLWRNKVYQELLDEAGGDEQSYFRWRLVLGEHRALPDPDLRLRGDRCRRWHIASFCEGTCIAVLYAIGHWGLHPSCFAPV
jgi:hypothetical protein